jgi:single-strand DNA-binding protein
MSNGNTVVLVGNVTRDPELRFTPTGQATTTFGLAVNRRWQNRQTQEWEEATSFFDVVCWRELAENVALSLTKGMRVVVAGRLEQRTWETDEGDRRTKVEVVADEVGPSLRFATADVHRVERHGSADGAAAGKAPEGDPADVDALACHGGRAGRRPPDERTPRGANDRPTGTEGAPTGELLPDRGADEGRGVRRLPGAGRCRGAPGPTGLHRRGDHAGRALRAPGAPPHRSRLRGGSRSRRGLGPARPCLILPGSDPPAPVPASAATYGAGTAGERPLRPGGRAGVQACSFAPTRSATKSMASELTQ